MKKELGWIPQCPHPVAVTLMVHIQQQRTSSLAARRIGLQPETGHAWLTVGSGVRKAGQGRL